MNQCFFQEFHPWYTEVFQLSSCWHILFFLPGPVQKPVLWWSVWVDVVNPVATIEWAGWISSASLRDAMKRGHKTDLTSDLPSHWYCWEVIFIFVIVNAIRFAWCTLSSASMLSLVVPSCLWTSWTQLSTMLRFDQRSILVLQCVANLEKNGCFGFEFQKQF